MTCLPLYPMTDFVDCHYSCRHLIKTKEFLHPKSNDVVYYVFNETESAVASFGDPNAQAIMEIGTQSIVRMRMNCLMG